MYKMNTEESNNGSKKLQICNSTAEFLIFQIEPKNNAVGVTCPHCGKNINIKVE